MPAAVGTERISQEVLKEHQRERVIRAAIKVFAKRGYQGTTVDHLVAAAKIGVGNFYSLFDGKEECFLLAYSAVVDAARERVEEALPTDGDWPHQVRAGLQAVLEMIEEEPAQARLALAEVQTAGPAALERYRETMDSIEPLLARGRELSPIAEQLPPRLEEGLVGGLAWFLQQRILSGEFKGAAAHLPEALEIVVEPYLGPEAVAELAAGA